MEFLGVPLGVYVREVYDSFEMPEEWMIAWKQAGDSERIVLAGQLAEARLQVCMREAITQRLRHHAAELLTSELVNLQALGLPFCIKSWQIQIVRADVHFVPSTGSMFPVFVPEWGAGTAQYGWQLYDDVVPLGYYIDNGLYKCCLYWNRTLDCPETQDVQPPSQRFTGDSVRYPEGKIAFDRALALNLVKVDYTKERGWHFCNSDNNRYTINGHVLRPNP